MSPVPLADHPIVKDVRAIELLQLLNTFLGAADLVPNKQTLFRLTFLPQVGQPRVAVVIDREVRVPEVLLREVKGLRVVFFALEAIHSGEFSLTPACSVDQSDEVAAAVAAKDGFYGRPARVFRLRDLYAYVGGMVWFKVWFRV